MLSNRSPLLSAVLVAVGLNLVSFPALSMVTSAQPGSKSTSSQVVAQASPSTYRDANGLFEISFPAGYTFTETGTGISFVSRDRSFGGVVDTGSANGRTFTNDQLEASLKAEYENRLSQVTWQGSEEQADGSLRVDWVGTDTDGNDLDAISFIEQHGDTIYILNLYGVNTPYQDHNNDARVIVGSYRVSQ